MSAASPFASAKSLIVAPPASRRAAIARPPRRERARRRHRDPRRPDRVDDLHHVADLAGRRALDLPGGRGLVGVHDAGVEHQPLFDARLARRPVRGAAEPRVRDRAAREHAFARSVELAHLDPEVVALEVKGDRALPQLRQDRAHRGDDHGSRPLFGDERDALARGRERRASVEDLRGLLGERSPELLGRKRLGLGAAAGRDGEQEEQREQQKAR